MQVDLEVFNWRRQLVVIDAKYKADQLDLFHPYAIIAVQNPLGSILLD